MSHLMTRQLDLILKESELDVEQEFVFEINPSFLDIQAKEILEKAFGSLGGNSEYPLLRKLKFDFKIKRFLILYDEEYHFNRYRLNTFKSELYNLFTFQFVETQKRLSRSFERDCLKVALQERKWFGPPIARACFGEGSEPGDFSSTGAPGWKLQAFNDLQIDLQTRIHGYKLIRLSPYETLMISGGLKRLDQLLINPKEETRAAILKWFERKLV